MRSAKDNSFEAKRLQQSSGEHGFAKQRHTQVEVATDAAAGAKAAYLVPPSSPAGLISHLECLDQRIEVLVEISILSGHGSLLEERPQRL